jgi:hypothetical protein
VTARRGWVGVGAVAVVVWLGLAYCATPPDAHEYRETAVQQAQAALGAVRTVAVAGAAAHDGRLLPPYLSTVIDNAAGSVASAQRQLDAQPPPDAGSSALRDQLAPLLLDAARQIAGLDLALSGSGDVAARLDALARLGDRLADFAERYR